MDLIGDLPAFRTSPVRFALDRLAWSRPIGHPGRSAEDMIILAFIVSGTLALIAGLHIYWAFGGQWAARIAIPKREDGSPSFSPGPIACLLVATGLLAIAAVCIARFALIAPVLSASLATTIFWFLAVVFALRLIGDFRYVGMFRKVKHTDFARMDARLYSPLCGAYSAAFVAFAMA
ncbi:MAG TPA: DUF3995 domain-containing protein [Terrimicrobiaceae bacterium]